MTGGVGGNTNDIIVMSVDLSVSSCLDDIIYATASICWPHYRHNGSTFVERNGSGVQLLTLDYENPGSNPVLRC